MLHNNFHYATLIKSAIESEDYNKKSQWFENFAGNLWVFLIRRVSDFPTASISYKKFLKICLN